MTLSLTPESFRQAVHALGEQDSDLAGIVAQYGVPTPAYRELGFATLVYIILEQQVSLASARAVFEKLLVIAKPLTPRAFLSLDDDQLRGCGLSRQKMGYCRGLAAQIVRGDLGLEEFSDLPGNAVRERLIAIKGIGPWTADVYLLTVLRRPDIFPVGDLALQVAAQKVKRLSARPSAKELGVLGERWRPWRSVAARLLWHWYVSQ